jgi:phosphatidylglycerophosphatase C
LHLVCEPRALAAFDFDGTLCRRDSVVPFLRRVAGTARLAGGMAAVAHRLAPAAARRDRDTIKALAAGVVFRGRTVAEVSTIASDYAEMVVTNWLRADVVERFQSYRRSGAAVVIISASFELYLHPIGRALGADAALGTRLEVRDDSFTGRLDGPNCRRAEKVRRLEQWLTENGIDREDLTIDAFGDSAGDLDLLAAADHGWWAARRTLAPWSAS